MLVGSFTGPDNLEPTLAPLASLAFAHLATIYCEAERPRTASHTCVSQKKRHLLKQQWDITRENGDLTRENCWENDGLTINNGI